MKRSPLLLLAGALVLAGSGGYLAATALGTGSQAPTRTVTLTIPTGTGQQGPAGATGPAGPPGPKGDPGAESCPAGYEFSALLIIVQGQGPTQIATCLKT